MGDVVCQAGSNPIVRPQLPVGTAGKIRTYPASNGYRATTIYRDYDGRNRQIERHGKTKNAAQRALAEAIRDRPDPSRTRH